MKCTNCNKPLVEQEQDGKNTWFKINPNLPAFRVFICHNCGLSHLVSYGDGEEWMTD